MTAAQAVTEGQAVFERLEVDPFIPCDGHASHAIQALVTMLTPAGSLVYLCGHHARREGWEHTADANRVEENKLQGSSN